MIDSEYYDRKKNLLDKTCFPQNMDVERRKFLKLATLLAAATFGYVSFDTLSYVKRYLLHIFKEPTELHPPIYNPDTLIQQNNRVVVVHDSRATSWDFTTGWYGDYVNQSVVDNMVNTGIMKLTGTPTIGDAWKALIPHYVSGDKIAIKVNFNNSMGYTDTHNNIDALMQPIDPIIAGLKEIGVSESDIWIYDALRPIPDRFINKCRYNDVSYYDIFGHEGRKKASFESTSPDTYINFVNSNIQRHQLTDVITTATYIINIPIIKQHGGAGVTLSMKNHLGSLNPSTNTAIENIPDLHAYLYLFSNSYSPRYNPLIDINSNPHINNKTILIIGDGLYGNWYSNWQKPRRWRTYNNSALNTLFFSRNAVAIDSVMYDFLSAETGIDQQSDDYLHIAAAKGLGVHEHRSRNNKYRLIDYVAIDFDT